MTFLLAQLSDLAGSTAGKVLLAFVANPVVWGIIALIIFVVLISKTKHATVIRDAAVHAYHIVEGMAARGEIPPGLTKETEALKKFAALLETQGYKVTDAVIELAKLLWASYASQQNQAAAAIKSGATAVPVLPSAPVPPSPP